MKTKLPKYVARIKRPDGVTHLYFRKGHGPYTRLPDDLASMAFAEMYDRLIAGEDMTRATITERYHAELERLIRVKVKHARIRSGHAQRQITTITPDWGVKTLREQNYRCAVTGVPFHVYQGVAQTTDRPRLQPYSPSLDRIDNSLGYTSDNVRIVLSAYNMMRLDWPEEVFSAVVNAYKGRPNSPTAATPCRGKPKNIQ